MSNLSEAMTLGTAGVPIDASRVRLVWASGYWDGPLSGLATLDGELLVFSFADEENEDAGDDSWYRHFFLVRPPEARLRAFREVHAAFQRHVGTHFDYGESGTRDPTQLHPSGQHATFYDEHPPGSGDDFMDCEVVGWFEL